MSETSPRVIESPHVAEGQMLLMRPEASEDGLTRVVVRPGALSDDVRRQVIERLEEHDRWNAEMDKALDALARITRRSPDHANGSTS